MVVVTAAFAAAEIAIRQSGVDVATEYWAHQEWFQPDPILLWDLQRNAGYRWLGDEERFTNEWGFRDEPTARRKPPRVTRVVCLGDSATFGYGVRNGWKLYPKVAQRILNEEYGGGFEVINAGIPGYRAYQGLMLFQDRVAAMEPDVVTVYFGNNDLPDDAGECTEEIRLADRVRRLLFHSRLYMFLRKQQLTRAGQPAVRTSEPRCSYGASLAAIFRLARAKGIRAVAITAATPLHYPYADPTADSPKTKAVIAAVEAVAGLAAGEDRVEAARGLVVKYADSPHAWYALGEALEAADRADEAAEAYATGVDLLPRGMNASNSGHRRIAAKAAVAGGADVVDAFALLRTDEGRPVLGWEKYFADLIHPNEAGHEKVARALAEKIASYYRLEHR